jgi:hypothetical protein
VNNGAGERQRGVRYVGRFGLVAADGPDQPITLDEHEATQLASELEPGQLWGLALAAMARGELVVPGPTRDHARTRHHQGLVHVATLDLALVEAGAALRRAGLAARVLKGPAVALLDEVVPAWRCYGDLAVLVPEGTLLEAAATLEAIGYRAVQVPVRRQWARRYAKSLTMAHRSGVEIDLHQMLAAGPFGRRIHSAALFDRGETFVLGGHPFVALDRVQRFLHACYHAVLGGQPNIRHARDVAVTAQGLQPLDLVGHERDGWSMTVTARAIQWAQQALDGGFDAAWTTWARTRPVDADDLADLAAYGGSFAALARADAQALPGWGNKARYVAGLAVPEPAYLAWRGEDRVGRLRRLTRGRA